MSIAEPWLLLVYPLFAVIIWAATLTALSIGGGWRALAQRFPATGPRAGAMWSFTSATFRTRLLPVHYGNCVTVAVGDAGVRLGMLFVFRAMHPPILIPWSAIDSVGRQAGSLHRRAAVLAIRDFDRRVVLYGNAGEKVASTFDRLRGSASLDGGRRSRPITLSAAQPLA
ncbi:MAG TPA: hypothetical protein VIF57_13750 [Polyangia bacterium]|jgi:hypothetical protein